MHTGYDYTECVKCHNQLNIICSAVAFIITKFATEPQPELLAIKLHLKQKISQNINVFDAKLGLIYVSIVFFPVRNYPETSRRPS